ncbi:MAG: hypothetical protein E5X65_35245, partial [Mesorhizobium sp.]
MAESAREIRWDPSPDFGEHCCAARAGYAVTETKSSDGAVAIVATLDTKRAEASFVAEVIRSRGREIVFVDVGTSKDGAARSNDPAALLAEIGRNARASINALHVDGTITAILG